MDDIDKAIHYAATGVKPVKPVGSLPSKKDEPDYIPETEPVRIYAALDTLRINNTYYFLQWWVAAKEFQRSKLTRSNFIPHTEDDASEGKIEIEIHNVSDSPTEGTPV